MLTNYKSRSETSTYFLKFLTSASAGLQDANLTIQPWATPPPRIPNDHATVANSDCPNAISI